MMSLTNVNPEIVHKNVKLVKEMQYEGCKAHGLEHLINDTQNGTVVCCVCGVVVEDRIILEESEWRNFEDDSLAEKWAKCRTGDAANPFLSDDANIGTLIKQFGQIRNEGDNSFSRNIHRQFKRRSVDNALLHAFKEIRDMADRIHLPVSVTLLAQQHYQKLYKKIKLKGNIMLTDAKMAACVYVACKQQHCCRTQREISAISAVNKTDLTNAIRRLLQIIDLNDVTTTSTEMIDRFCSYLALTQEQRKEAYAIASYIDAQEWQQEMQPENAVAVSIYLATLTRQGKDIIKCIHYTHRLIVILFICFISSKSINDEKCFCFFVSFHAGTLTDPQYANECERLREAIAAAMGVTAHEIDALLMTLIEEESSLSLMANENDDQMVTD